MGAAMSDNTQKTLFAFDCGATNWRLYRLEYQHTQGNVSLLGEPQPSPLTSFSDRKLPAILCLNPEGITLDSMGEVAQLHLENEKLREQVREYFKPCIGVHLEENPLPHQKRYTHAQAMQYTRLMLEAVLNQTRQEKWRAQAFDDRLWFTFAYPIHWRYEHDGKIFKEYQHLVQSCFGKEFDQIRFVAEPEGAILCLQHRGLLALGKDQGITLIIDVGGSTTDIVAGEVDSKTGKLDFLGRYGEPFGGGLYDAELAKLIADELKIPASALADDPSAMIALRVAGQRLKESLSRQLLQPSNLGGTHQRSVTLVLQDGTVFRRTIALDEPRFREATQRLDKNFSQLVDHALEKMGLQPEKIRQIVLVGGGAQLFTIMNHLRERFGKDRVVLADNPDEIVVYGIGLEYQASFQRIEPTILFPAEKSQVESKGGPPPSTKRWFLFNDEKRYSLQPGLTKLGRGENNDIQVDSLKVSRLHAEISLSDNKIEIVDLGTTNGTSINGQRLSPHQPHELHTGDEIVLGNIKYVLNLETEER
jgi:hypothetical protein